MTSQKLLSAHRAYRDMVEAYSEKYRYAAYIEEAEQESSDSDYPSESELDADR